MNNVTQDTGEEDFAALLAESFGQDSVKEGENMAPPIEASGAFPPIVVSMVEVGEETGELPEMLMKIADNYDEDVDVLVASLMSLLEPVMIIVLGVIVGTIVLAIFLPMIQIITSLSGQQ